jgi:hypothetical protein
MMRFSSRLAPSLVEYRGSFLSATGGRVAIRRRYDGPVLLGSNTASQSRHR